jgi:4-hydroxyphenylacetate 3-monooxygenase
MFYAGARFTTAGHSFRTYDWPKGDTMVDHLLGSYQLSDELPSAAPQQRAAS